MPLYRYNITPTSAFGTPLRSDTLYGHLLWRAAERYGANRVGELIEGFADGPPPFRLSSVFPENCLPMPCLPPIPRSRFRERFAPQGGGELVERLQQYKRFRKLKHVRFEALQKLSGGLSQESLFAVWLEDSRALEPPGDFAVAAQQPHNSIDRASGKVLAEGGLHFSKVYWYRPGCRLHLYVEADTPDLFEELMRELQKTGYGADSSTGKGQFHFSRDESFDPSNWPAQGNARLLLSLAAAESMRDVAGYWSPQVKRGKAWSGFGERNPFKKPFLALCEGSVLTALPESGYLLRNLHSNPEVVQVLWPLTLPLQLEVSHES